MVPLIKIQKNLFKNINFYKKFITNECQLIVSKSKSFRNFIQFELFYIKFN